MPNFEPIYALVIIAHPDDESFVFAGTTLKFEEEGKNVAIICATAGEKGADRLNRELSMAQMAKIRTKELLTACHILHCDCKKIMNHPDGDLDQTNFNNLVDELTNEINSYRPQIILTFGEEGISGHRDHIMISKAATKAAQQASPKPSEIWRACIPSSRVDEFHEHMEKRKIHHLHFIKPKLVGVADEKLIKIGVSKYKDKKIEALKAHESQYLAHQTWPGSLESEWYEIIKLS